MSLKIQLGESEYRIVDTASGTEGDLSEYGDVAELEVGGRRYIALVQEDENGEGDYESLLGDGWCYEVTATACEQEDVTFEDEGEPEPDEEEGGR